jgi:hypothetical protein
MDTFLEFVYHPNAADQLDELINGDLRFEDEITQYEWILCREPEKLGKLTIIAGLAIYIFMTAEKSFGPPRLAVSYQVFRQDSHIFVLDVRLAP